MKNVKSTIAMKLAHKIAKAFPKMTFKAALKYAWKQVRIDMATAKRILNGDYKISLKQRLTAFGKVNDIVFYAKGVKASVKRFFAGITKDDYVLSLWAGW